MASFTNQMGFVYDLMSCFFLISQDKSSKSIFFFFSSFTSEFHGKKSCLLMILMRSMHMGLQVIIRFCDFESFEFVSIFMVL